MLERELPCSPTLATVTNTTACPPLSHQVSQEERLILPARIANGCLPLSMGSLHEAVRSQADLDELLWRGRWAGQGTGGGKGLCA